MNKRHDPCFWIEDRCEICNYSNTLIYSPDLIEAPIERKCIKCNSMWTLHLTVSTVKEIKKLLKVAKRQEFLKKELISNRKLLGYRD